MSLFNLLFGCSHSNLTWPQTDKHGTRIVCLDCGQVFPCRPINEGLKPPVMTCPVKRVETGIQKHERETAEDVQELKRMWEK